MQRTTFLSYWTAFIACLGGFLQSYVTCVIAGALPFITKEFTLTPIQQGNIASVILVGALVGALTSGFLADRLGRKWSLSISALIFFICSFVSPWIGSYSFLLFLRFIIGYAVGMTAILVPLYLAEISPPVKRGAFVGSYQFLITVGTLAAYLVNLMYTGSGHWRMMMFAAAIPAAFQWFFLFLFPESPKWLKAKGKFEMANVISKKLSLPKETKVEKSTSQKSLFSKPFIRLIVIGVALAAFQQFCGINAVVYFAPKIFKEAGIETDQGAILATICMGIVNVIAGFLAVLLIDRLGRRKLLITSQIGVIATLAILIVSFVLDNAFVDKLALGGAMLYIFLYALGFGPIVPILYSEIYPLSIRAKAISLVVFVSWLSNYLVVFTFPQLVFSMGSAATFGIYAGSTLLALWFCYRQVPETKGKSLEELEKELVRKR